MTTLTLTLNVCKASPNPPRPTLLNSKALDQLLSVSVSNVSHKEKKYGRVKQGQVRSGQKVERHVSVVTTVSLLVRLVPNPRRLPIVMDTFLDFFLSKSVLRLRIIFFRIRFHNWGYFFLHYVCFKVVRSPFQPIKFSCRNLERALTSIPWQ